MIPIPTVHLNGTSQDALLDAIETARGAVVAAQKAIEAASPNVRDYYPQGAGALSEAQAWYRLRVLQLAALADELQEIAIAISDGGKR